MSDNNLAVKITADVVDLQAKFAIARAETNALTAEMNKLARASAAGTIDPQESARLTQVAGEMLTAKANAAGLSAQLEAAGGSFGQFSGSMEGARGGMATTAREVHRLFTELQSGNTGGADVTILRLAQHLMGLGPAGLIAVGAVGALTAGLGLLIARSIEASNALDNMAGRAAVAGNDFPRDKLQQFVTQIAHSADISEKEAAKIAAALSSLPDMAGPAMQTLVADTRAGLAEFGGNAEELSKELTKLFSPEVSAAGAAKLIGQFASLSQAQIDSAQTADKTGDANQVAAAKAQLWTDALARGIPQWSQATAVQRALVAIAAESDSAIAGDISQEELLNDVVTSQNKVFTDNLAIARQRIAVLAETPATPEQTIKVGVEAAQGENPVSKQVDEAKTKIAEMAAALAEAKTRGDAIDVATLNAGLAKARENLAALQFGPVLDQMRTQMAQVAATWDGTQTGMLEKQREIAAQTLASVSGNTKERLAVEQEVSRLDVEIRKSAAADIIATVRNQNAQISADTKLTAAERLEAEQESWLELLANDRVVGQQRQEVERELTTTSVALAKERASQVQAIERENSAADISISKMEIEAQKSVLDTELAAHQVNAAQKLQILKTLTQQESALNLQELQNELSTLNELTPEYARVYNEIRELKAKLILDMAQLDRQAATDAKKAADEEAKDWAKAVGEIESAEGAMLSDLLAKRKSFGAAALQFAGTLVNQEIQNDVKAVTTRLLLYREGDASQKALEQGGLLYHMATTQAATNVDKVAATQQVATVTTANAQQTGATTTAEAQKTAATAAGVTQRTAAQAAGDATGVTEAMTAGLAQIQINAAVAATGAAASVAAIPFVGWAMAPEVAAATEAETLAYAGALDKGAWEVPGTMMATIHQGESVVPRDFASGLRASGGIDSGRSGGATTYGDTNINQHFHQVMPSTDAIMAHVTKALRNFHPATRGMR